MIELIFATNNRHKAQEIQASIGDRVKIISLEQANIHIDIPEPHDTLEMNASEKSHAIFDLTGKNCFSEDTGLEVDALYGAPGVKSARYAGDDKAFDRNIQKLLAELQNASDRKAKFRTVISLIINAKEYWFDGICEGIIEREPRGKWGLGMTLFLRLMGAPERLEK